MVSHVLLWKRLRLRGYPVKFLLPIFREMNYSNRKKWFSKPEGIHKRRSVVSKPPIIVAILVSKALFLSIYQTLVVLLVTNQLTQWHIYASK